MNTNLNIIIIIKIFIYSARDLTDIYKVAKDFLLFNSNKCYSLII